jgi:hypothetical protein
VIVIYSICPISFDKVKIMGAASRDDSITSHFRKLHRKYGATVDPEYTRIALFIGIRLLELGQGISKFVYNVCIAVTADNSYAAACWCDILKGGLHAGSVGTLRYSPKAPLSGNNPPYTTSATQSPTFQSSFASASASSTTLEKPQPMME